jgi:single-strand DNA-binding protein
MNSFTLTAVGNLARNPEAVAKGDVMYTRFCLVGNDYAGKDEKGTPREIVTSLWFVAFGPLGEALVRNTRKGDQLIVEAQVRANNWTDKQGEKQYDHDFVVQGFRFGAPGKAKREEFSGRLELGGRSDHDGKSDLEGRGPDSKLSLDAKTKSAKSAAEGDAEVGADPSAMLAGTPAPAIGAPAGTSASAKNGGASYEKQSAQRAGRRTTAPPS